MSTYTYSLNSDFSGNLNLAQLHEIIEQNATITPALVGISNTNDDVEIVFDTALSGAEQTELNTIVSNYIRADKPVIGLETTGSNDTTLKITTAQTANRTVTIPDATGTFVIADLAQTLTNKTIDASANTVQNIVDANIKNAAEINASKIADGTVGNTQFQYLSGASSNIQTQISDHVGDFNNPHNVTKTQLGLSNVQNIKNSINATNPTVTDDSGDGYSVGSTWINTTTNTVYFCTDATASAAVWVETTQIIPSAANIGTAGVGLYSGTVANEFKFKKLNSKSSKIAVTDDVANDEVDIDVNSSQILIGDLSGAPTGAVVGTTDAQTLTNKTLGGDLDAGTHTVTNLASPSGDSDAATKKYVDDINTAVQSELDTKLTATAPIVVSSTTQTSTTSNNYIVMPSMTTTPAAGTYIVSFSGSVRATETAQTVTVAIYVGGSVVAHSERDFHNVAGISFFNNINICYPVQTQVTAVLNGSQTVDVRIKTTGGARVDILKRNLILVKAV